MKKYCPKTRVDILERLIDGERACDIQRALGLTSSDYYLQIRKGRRGKTKVNVARHIAKHLAATNRSPVEIRGKTLRHMVSQIMEIPADGDDSPNPDDRASVPANGETLEDLQMLSILCSRLLRTQNVPDDVYQAIDTAQTEAWKWAAKLSTEVADD